jgi:3'-phosphoadenosine 5'-phosphosulfate sulfotransferase (PAPS reductase)/FAD synthetase
MINETNAAVNLADYDFIVINTSGGKDSQAMMDHVVGLARAAGVLDRVIAVHADLGRVEWKGTTELVKEQCAHYGLRLEIVRREKGDLLDQIEARGMFPDSSNRYCTSDQKRDQVAKLHTRLVAESGLDRKVRILNCMGLRAEESPARAKKRGSSRTASVWRLLLAGGTRSATASLWTWRLPKRFWPRSSLSR